MAANEFYKIGYWNKMNQGLLEQATDNFTYRNVNRCNLLDGTVNGDGGTENWYPVEQWQSNYKCITMANTFLENLSAPKRLVSLKNIESIQRRSLLYKSL